jgi:hypothetical protein
MNQDHLSQQPAADKYVTGDPSTFAEDIHPNDWSVEYSNGQTSRNEIGMPEMRKDTFNHPEKTAALDEETLVKKADLCCKVARQILGSKAVESAIEDQALALMNLSDSDLIATVNRMAQDQDQQDQGQKQAQDQQDQDQGQKQAQDQDQQQAQDEGKQAKELPPEFLENIQKKKDEAKDKKDKEAAVKVGQLEQMAQQLQQMSQQIQQLMQQQGQQQSMPQAQQQVVQEQTQDLDQQANDQMIDQMLAQGQPQMQEANDFGIQMDSPQMDIGEVSMTPEDDVLTTLFANNTEVQNAQQAHVLQHGAPASMQVQASGPMARTASTRTVGTRPSGGVASIGGLGAPAARSTDDVSKLSSLWNSAPDVSDVFRS